MSTTKIGIIGCGNISGAYFQNTRRFPNLDLVACADIDVERAKKAAADKGVVHGLSPQELIASPEIELVINLTIPQAHAEVDQQVLAGGKHVFSEKPFALTLAEGNSIVAAAKAAGKRVGCAPDTVLGGAVQTCRGLVDRGDIGQPVAFTAVMQGGGHESWHPAPEFYYLKGGGPVFDMGPYYLHALITLLGPIRQITGMAKISFAERLITSEPKKGTKVKVEIPTHVTSILEFANGTIGTFIMSFDIKGPFTNPCIEIYGSEASLRVPDPNGSSGPISLGKKGQAEWTDVPYTHAYLDAARGLGVAEMASAIKAGRDHRANERIALHALEAMEGMHVSAQTGTHYKMTTTCERPEPMRGDLPEFTLD